jgi:hypothetical protein
VFKISKINENDLGKIDAEVEFQNLDELAGAIMVSNWSPARFNGRRTIKDALELSLLVFDVDDGCVLPVAKTIFKEYQYIIATTKSHQREKNGKVCDRFRVILPLSSPITNDEDYKATFEYYRNKFPFVDQTCKDISRFFYPCTAEFSHINEIGAKVSPQKAIQPVINLVRAGNDGRELSRRGQLFNSTLNFLMEGAEPGHRHNALVKAVMNMREQGYAITEDYDKLTNLVEVTGDDCYLDDSSKRTISDLFTRELKGEFRPQEETTDPIYVLASELLDETIDYLSDKDRVKGDPTGVEGLDKLLGGGFRHGELTVLMAQAKTGKNTLYHHLLHSILSRGEPIGYASRELDPAREVIPNLLSIALSTNSWKSTIDDNFKEKAKEQLAKWPLYFAPGYGFFPIEDMKKWFETLTALGVRHFWMDHFHYMLDDENTPMVSRTIKEIKTLAKKFDCHINLIVQPKNLMEGQRLSMDSLKGGSAINQALDNLLILERVPEQKNISRLRLEVARHKLAKPGDMFLKYDPVTTAFEEVEFDPHEAEVKSDLQALTSPQNILTPKKWNLRTEDAN